MNGRKNADDITNKKSWLKHCKNKKNTKGISVIQFYLFAKHISQCIQNAFKAALQRIAPQ